MSLPCSFRLFGSKAYAVLAFSLLALACSSCRQKTGTAAGDMAGVPGDSIVARATRLRDSGDARQSIAYVEAAYRSFPDTRPLDRWKKYRFLVSAYLSDQPDTAKARSYTDSLMRVCEGDNLSNREAYAQTLFAKGDVLMVEKKYLEAFNQYYDGRSYAAKNLDSCELAPFTGQLAMIKYRQRQFREAIPYFRSALAENARCGRQDNFDQAFSLPQNSLNTMALCYEELSKDDSALFYLKKAYILTERGKRRFPGKAVEVETARGIVAGNLGDIYQLTGHLDSARYYLTECIRTDDRPGYAIAMADIAKINLVFMALGLHQTPRFNGILSQDENRLKAIKSGETDKILLMEYWYALKRNYHRSIHQMDSAYFYQKKYHDYCDSLQNAERNLRQADMNSVFATRAQEYRLSLLAKDDKIKRRSLLLTMLTGLMALTGLLVVWNNLNRSRKNVAELTRLNRKVSEQNEQMEHALSALEQSQADNSRMMKIVAHDLRNPIGAIKMAASLITSKTNEWPENQKVLDIITRSADSSLQLVSELLQTPAKAVELKKDAVDLSAMLQYCADLLAHKAIAKGQHIVLNTLPLTLPGSREKLWRVVSNLMANAIKFSPEGAVIVVSLEKRGSYARIAVKDQGIGIPEGMKDKLFDLFTEAKRPGTAGEQSFGMGLAISRQIVEAHDGKIWLESQPGQGTVFFVELPL